MAKPIESFPNLQLGYFSLSSFASKLGFAVVKGKIFSAYCVTVDKEPGRRKKVVNTARDDDASGLLQRCCELSTLLEVSGNLVFDGDKERVQAQ
jgi:hypothetical protein